MRVWLSAACLDLILRSGRVSKDRLPSPDYSWDVIEPSRRLTNLLFVRTPESDGERETPTELRTTGETNASHVYKEGTAAVAPGHVEGD
jgi:hypothetical protein